MLIVWQLNKKGESYRVECRQPLSFAVIRPGIQRVATKQWMERSKDHFKASCPNGRKSKYDRTTAVI
jgi:hypothetical protein